MDIKDFLNHTAAGNAVKAQEILDDILSNKAFEALDEKKTQIAKTLYATEDEVEVQDTADTPVEDEELLTQEEFDSLSEEDQELYLESLEQINELKKSTLGSYVKKAAKSKSDDAFDHGEDEHRQYGEPGEDPDRDKDIEDRERRMANREKGIGRAVKRLTKEEMEQIHELSKGTLGSYVKKASESAAKRAAGSTSWAFRSTAAKNPRVKAAAEKYSDEDEAKKEKRLAGVTKAVNRLTKEEMEQIDELSKGTLGRYVQKRVKQIPNIEVNYQMTPDEDGPMGAKRIKKFQKKINKGVTGALNRLSGTNVTKKPTK